MTENKEPVLIHAGITGVCQFCGREAGHEGGDEAPSGGLPDTWIALVGMSPPLSGIHGEWCSMECFWSDLFEQVNAEKVDRDRFDMVIRPC